MRADFIYNFIAMRNYAVLATVSKENTPESALIGFAVTPDLKIIFDTLRSSRKYHNIISNPSVSLVIGWDDEQTIQYEGRAYTPDDEQLHTLLNIYFKVFPDGQIRQKNWKDLVYVLVIPEWIRYSDYNEPAKVEVMKFK